MVGTVRLGELTASGYRSPPVSEYPELDEQVDGVRRRSESAFATVYRLTVDDLTSFAYGMLHDRSAAEDAVQQTFLELARAASSLRGDGRTLRAWLFRSLRYNCLDELRRRRRRPETPTDVLPDDPVDPPEVDVDLEEALAMLTERQRTMVLLKHVAGLSGEEIAQVLDSNRVAVYAALGRAERRLRSLLEDGGERG